ncbi:class I SAM-dependent methyltransferase [Desulfovibrio psychrotolerans]|uniref:Methyltransferase domain-containing protein n=1 Tax=Desulfovibrio psychrotolerans TaxID=415242 RepID=A0A7J0BYQ4_9BACT|nr:class I SAM-dependent methyltransferase [Desulfovibrio psychrotolerans]GFM38114.1 hypothetical protein DSM19430T_27980 [Desulfovibrio psychrotolerans]
MKETVKKAVRALTVVSTVLAYPFTAAFFWVNRWVLDNDFVLRQYPRLGKPSYWAVPFVAFYHLVGIIHSGFKASYSNYAIKQYHRLTPLHYAPGGRGYLSLKDLSEAEKTEKYQSLVSRASMVLDKAGMLALYRDGDSFLDAGCGMGKNIRFLSQAYPNSKITGFDINESALDLIKSAEKNPNVTVEKGSILEPAYMASLPANGFDHVIMSHVMGFICVENEKVTAEIRQSIVDNLVRVANKSFLLLDSHSSCKAMTVEIEQKNRCRIYDNLTRYFEKHLNTGELYLVPSPETTGFYYVKR